MADIQSNIKVHIDTSQALASIKALQAQISAFHVAMGKSNAANAATSAQMQQQLMNGINATGKFAASIKTIKTSAESFTTALEKNKLTMGEYFRYAGGASKTFGKLFKSEFETINKVARERVKDLQTQYIKLGRDANGAMKAIKVRPLMLDMDNLATKTALAAQKQQLLNQLLKQGSTNLLNFGKNTQWAGRQLMVGFTVPLTMFAAAAIKSFNQIETAMVKIKRVYGDMATTSDETNKMADDLKKLAESYTKYGMAVADTLDMAATAAATGKTGIELLKQVDAAAKLAALGGIDQAKALETTISLTNTFGIAADDLTSKIDFLNAVENQTILNIDDLTEAIPKAAPIIKQLGGNVQDLAFFMTAMREGGISASQGANALKSGMASIINPTKQAVDMLSGFGIGIKEIVNRDKGDIKQTFLDLATALDKLDPLNRARAIEQLFGKFQFARMSTLFKNIADQNSQASKVLALSKETPQELAILSRRELAKTSQSPTYQFQKAMQDFKTGLAPIGAEFIKVFLPIMKGLTGFLKKFNEMGPGAKGFIVGLVTVVAGLGPVLLMTFGLLANGFANIIKGFVAMKNFFNSTGKSTKTLGEQTKYMTQEQIEAAAVAASLDQVHGKLTQTFTAEREALQLLIAEYQKAAAAQGAINGGVPITRMGGVKKYATGVVSVPGPKGAGDIVPAMLSPGEAVIPSKMASKYAPLIHGMVNDTVPGFMSGTVGIGMTGLTERQIEGRLRGIRRLEEISESVVKSELASMPITTYGRQISPSIGKSFPGWGIGGVYEAANGGRVFVKPMISVEEAKAELRATQIAREVHGLESPVQKLVVMRDPTDAAGQRVFAALESEFNPKIANMKTSFTKDEMAKQLVASLLRGDKDLAMGNLGGSMLADVGTAGVFEKASGGKEGLARKLAIAMPSMESQAMINLLGVKGGAKKWFAQATSDIARGMSPAEYHTLISTEIDTILPKLKRTVDNFKNLTVEEQQAYSHMIQRLEEGKKVDWSRFQGVHSAVPGLANGIVSVPGPKGAGDIYPAMLSPGEAVIPAKMSKKYAGLISGMVNDTIPGFEFGTTGSSQAQSLSKYFLNWEGSHGSQLTQQNMPGFIGRAIAANPELAKLRVEVRELVYVMNDLGQVVPGVVKKMVTLDKIPQYKEALTAGGGYGFAAKAELHSVNQAYNQIPYSGPGNVAGKVPGFAMTSDERVVYGKAAEEALIANKNGTLKLTKEYIPAIEAMARQGKEEAAILADVSRADNRRKQVLLENIEALSMQGRMVSADGSVLEKSSASKAQMAAIEKQVSMDIVAVEKAMIEAERQGLRGQQVVNAGLVKYAEIIATSTAGFTVTNATGNVGQNILLRDINKNTAMESTAANIAHEEAKAAIGKKNSNSRTLVKRLWNRSSEQDYLGFRGGKQSKEIVAAASGSGRTVGLSLPKEVLAQIESIGSQAGQGFINGLKKILKISSPSRTLFDLGKQAGQGMLNGVKEKFGQAKEIGRELAASANAGIASMRGGAVAGGVPAPMPVADPWTAFGDAPITRDNIGLRGSELDQYNANSTGTSVGRQRLARYGNAAGRIGMGALRGGGRMVGRGINAGIKFAERKYQERRYYQDLNYATRQKIAEHEAMNQQLLAEGKEPIPHPELSPEEKEAMRRNPSAEEKKINKQARKQQRRAIGGKLMGAGMALSTAAMMGSMMPGEIGKQMQNLMMPIMALSIILPMLTSPIGLVVVALGALALALYSINSAFEGAQEAAIKNADAMGASTKAITKLSEFAGTVTSSEYMNEVRKNQFAILGFGAGKKSFGESYAGTSAGKALSKSLAEATSKGNSSLATEQLYSQLSGSVMSGALSMAQAKSIAMNEALKAGNISIGIDVVGKMEKLLGPNGEDLTKAPLQVRLKMVQESNQRVQNEFKTTTSGVQSIYGDRNAAMTGRGLGALGLGAAGFLAGGAIAGGIAAASAGTAIAAGAAAGSIVPGLGTAIGAVIGLGVGAFFMWQSAQEAAEKAGKLTGATIADAKIALEENKQMIDSMDVYYQKKIDQLKAQGKINEATALEVKYLKDRQRLVDAQAKTSKMIVDQVNKADKQSGEVGDAYVKGAEKALSMAYKGDVNQTLYIDANKQKLTDLRNLNYINKGQQTEILLKMASKDISPSQMSHMLDLMSKGKQNTELGLEIMTKFTGSTAAQASEVLSLVANTKGLTATEELSFLAKVKAQPSDKEAQKLINAIGAMTTAENIIPANVGIQFYLKNSTALSKYEGMLAKIGPNGVKDITAFYNIIPKINNAGLATLNDDQTRIFFNRLKNPKERAVFTTVMAMEFSISDQEIMQSPAFIAWLKDKGAGFMADATGVQQYRVQRAYTAAQDASQMGIGGGGGGGGNQDTPQASFLDDMVAKIRNVYNWQQRLTVGWKPSKEALLNFIKTGVNGFNGLAVGLANAGAGPNLISAVLGAEPEQINQIIDKTTGQITTFGQQLIAVSKDLLEEGGRAGIVAKWLGLTSDEKLQERVSMFQAGLDVLAGKEKKINDAYDKRIKALDEIQSINDRVNQQESDKLDVADALSKGDIAAAARAAQKLKTDNVSAALDATKKSLELARTQELDNLEITINGKLYHRIDLENQIETITAKINQNKVDQLANEVAIGTELDKNIGKQKRLNALANGGGGGAPGDGPVVVPPHEEGDDAGKGMKWHLNEKNKWVKVDKYKEGQSAGTGTGKIWSKVGGKWNKVWDPGGSQQQINSRLVDFVSAQDSGDQQLVDAARQGLFAELPGKIRVAYNWIKQSKTLWEQDNNYLAQYLADWNDVSGGKKWDQLTPQKQQDPKVSNAWTTYQRYFRTMTSRKSAFKGFRDTLLAYKPRDWWEGYGFVSGDDYWTYPAGDKITNLNHYASGGHIRGAGTGTSDSIPAMLSNGEYVIRANAVKTIGVNTLDKLNQADRIGFKNGGYNGYASGGLLRYADGGYTDRNNPEYWDSRRRYIMHKGEYLWMLAERFLPFQPPGTTLNDFAQQIIASNVNPNSGNPSKLSVGEHVFIPGITDVFPGKSGEPLKPSKKKKSKSKIWGTDIRLGESHAGQGGGGIGGGLLGFGPKMYANGGLVGYKDGGFMDTAGYNAGQVHKKYKPVSSKPKFGLDDIARGLTNPVIQGGANGQDVLGGMDLADSYKNIFTGKGDFWDYFSGILAPFSLGLGGAGKAGTVGKTLGKNIPKFNWRAVLDTLTARRRSVGPNELKPNSLSYVGNFGPGRYYGTDMQSLLSKWGSEYGNNVSKITLDPRGFWSIIKSKGYMPYEEYTARLAKEQSAIGGISLDKSIQNMSSPFIQGLLKEGYIGTKKDDAKLLTSWILGDQKGIGIKNIGEWTRNNLWTNTKNPLQILENMVRSKFGKNNGIAYALTTAQIVQRSVKEFVERLKSKYIKPKEDVLPEVEGATGGLLKDGKFHYANGGYAGGGRVKKDGAPNPFLDPVGWLKGLVGGIYAGGGNPSAYLDNTAAKGIKTGAKSTLGFYKDYLFDPNNPVDYAMAFVPGEKIAAKGVKVAGDIFKGLSLSSKTAATLIKAKVPKMMDILSNKKVFSQSMKDVYGNIDLGKDYKININSPKNDGWIDDYAVSKNGVVSEAIRHITGTIKYGPKNKPVGDFAATILKLNNELAVIDPYIQLQKEFKGKGIGQNFTSQSMALLKKMGVQKVNIEAGMSDGAYAWAKAGFKFKQYPNNLVSRMEVLNTVIKDRELQAMIKIFKKEGKSFKGPFKFEPADLLKLGKLSDRKTDKQLAEIVENIEAYKDSGILNESSYMGSLPVTPTVEWFKTHNLGEFLLRGANYIGTKKLAKGGLVVPRFKTGGYVGMMPKFADGGLANLHQGEYVFQKSAVDRIGLKNLNAMNQGDTISGDSVYNYNISLNVNSTSNSNDIADAVLGQIRRLDSQRIRGNRI